MRFVKVLSSPAFAAWSPFIRPDRPGLGPPGRIAYQQAPRHFQHRRHPRRPVAQARWEIGKDISQHFIQGLTNCAIQLLFLINSGLKLPVRSLGMSSTQVREGFLEQVPPFAPVMVIFNETKGGLDCCRT